MGDAAQLTRNIALALVQDMIDVRSTGESVISAGMAMYGMLYSE